MYLPLSLSAPISSGANIHTFYFASASDRYRIGQSGTALRITLVIVYKKTEQCAIVHYCTCTSNNAGRTRIMSLTRL